MVGGTLHCQWHGWDGHTTRGCQLGLDDGDSFFAGLRNRLGICSGGGGLRTLPFIVYEWRAALPGSILLTLKLRWTAGARTKISGFPHQFSSWHYARRVYDSEKGPSRLIKWTIWKYSIAEYREKWNPTVAKRNVYLIRKPNGSQGYWCKGKWYVGTILLPCWYGLSKGKVLYCLGYSLHGSGSWLKSGIHSGSIFAMDALTGKKSAMGLPFDSQLGWRATYKSWMFGKTAFYYTKNVCPWIDWSCWGILASTNGIGLLRSLTLTAILAPNVLLNIFTTRPNTSWQNNISRQSTISRHTTIFG
jgi:hypothetical protein